MVLAAHPGADVHRQLRMKPVLAQQHRRRLTRVAAVPDELRGVGIPIIALNMVGSITEHVDLVVSDPVQAGTMAVMAVAETATFDLERQRGRRY